MANKTEKEAEKAAAGWLNIERERGRLWCDDTISCYKEGKKAEKKSSAAKQTCASCSWHPDSAAYRRAADSDVMVTRANGATALRAAARHRRARQTLPTAVRVNVEGVLYLEENVFI